MPTTHEKIDELNKILSTQGADVIIDKIKESTGRGLPTKSYCKTFLETFPSIHIYRKELESKTKEELLSISAASVEFKDRLTALLHCVWKDILKRYMSIVYTANTCIHLNNHFYLPFTLHFISTQQHSGVFHHFAKISKREFNRNQFKQCYQ